MKNRALNPACALALCYAGMVCLAIAVNLMPVFLTTVRVDLGGRAGLTDEQLGRISAITFAGLVGGILFTGPLADRWGGKPFSVLGTLLIGVGSLLSFPSLTTAGELGASSATRGTEAPARQANTLAFGQALLDARVPVLVGMEEVPPRGDS